MSIIVNGVDMPNSCKCCLFCIPTEPDDYIDDSPYECVINQYLHWATWTDVPNFISEGCKISGIPTPHGRLIDADKLSISILKAMKNGDDSVIGLIDKTPTIIEAEQGNGR